MATVAPAVTVTVGEQVLSDEHEEIHVRRGPRSGLHTIVAVHSTFRGRSLGGCRLWTYDELDDAVRDAERLSRAMTFKAAAADVPLGGGKGVIALLPGEELTPARRHAALEDFGELVESFDGRYITAEDVGISTADLDWVSRHTRHVVGRARSHGGSGDPSGMTARGVEVAMRTALEHVTGDASPRGRSVTIAGLGHVGAKLATRLARAGARLTVSDIDERKRAIAERLGARWVSPGEAIAVPADVFSPCALGGVIDERTVEDLDAAIVCGAANNQLAHESLAERLRERGILWTPDFVANAGGLINVVCELEGDDPDRARERVLGIAGTLHEVFRRAAAHDSDTLAAAQELAYERLAARAAAKTI
jgi:leucine dehydrogenase